MAKTQAEKNGNVSLLPEKPRRKQVSTRIRNLLNAHVPDDAARKEVLAYINGLLKSQPD